MKIKEAIKKLQQIEKFDSEIELYFQKYNDDDYFEKIVRIAIHLHEIKTDEKNKEGRYKRKKIQIVGIS